MSGEAVLSAGAIDGSILLLADSTGWIWYRLPLAVSTWKWARKPQTRLKQMRQKASLNRARR